MASVNEVSGSTKRTALLRGHYRINRVSMRARERSRAVERANSAESRISGWVFFDASNERQRERRVRAMLGAREEKRESLKCSACGCVITGCESAISMAGAHTHWFSNPSGHTFHIGCFEHAPGCSRLGPETEEHSWFPGYAWTIALCTACGFHVGWRFRSPCDEFYGLILNRLVSEENR